MLFSHRIRRYIGRYVVTRDPRGKKLTQTDTRQDGNFLIVIHNVKPEHNEISKLL